MAPDPSVIAIPPYTTHPPGSSFKNQKKMTLTILPVGLTADHSAAVNHLERRNARHTGGAGLKIYVRTDLLMLPGVTCGT